MSGIANTVNQHTVRQDNNVKEMHERTRQIDALKKSLRPEKDKEKKLREACEGFESVFIQKMWEQMRATVPKNGLLQGKEEQHWQGMFDQELAKKMTSAGGIGIADMMYEQLSRNLVSASRTTASAISQQNMEKGAAFTPAPVSMLDNPVARKDAAGKAGGQAPDKLGNLGLYEEAVDAGVPTDPKNAWTPKVMSSAAGTDNGDDIRKVMDAGQANTPPEVQKALAELRARSGGQAQAGANQAVASHARPGANPASAAQVAAGINSTMAHMSGMPVQYQGAAMPANAQGLSQAHNAQAQGVGNGADPAQNGQVKTVFTTNIPPKVSSGRRITSPRQSKGDVAGGNMAIPAIKVLNNNNGQAAPAAGTPAAAAPGAQFAAHGAYQAAQAGGPQAMGGGAAPASYPPLTGQMAQGQAAPQAMAAPNAFATQAANIPPAPNPLTAAQSAEPVTAPASYLYEPARVQGDGAASPATAVQPAQQQNMVPPAPQIHKTSTIRQGNRDIFKSNVSGPIIPEV